MAREHAQTTPAVRSRETETVTAPADTGGGDPARAQSNELRGGGRPPIERMSKEQLKKVLYASGGATTRYDLSTGQPIDPGGYSFDEVQRAARRLDEMGGEKWVPQGEKGSPMSQSGSANRSYDNFKRDQLERSGATGVLDKYEGRSRLDGHQKGFRRQAQEHRDEVLRAKVKAPTRARTQIGGNLLVENHQLLSESVIQERHSEKGPLGIKSEGQTSALSASAQAGQSLSVSRDGISHTAQVGAKATLLEVKEEFSREIANFAFLGERMKGKIFVAIQGMIGVEGKAALQTNIGRYQPRGKPTVDPKQLLAGTGATPEAPKSLRGNPKITQASRAASNEAYQRDLHADNEQKGYGAGTEASAEAFAGAKVKVSAGAAFEWDKKAPDEYKPMIARSSAAILSFVRMINPPMGWLLAQIGAERMATSVLGVLFEGGQAGSVPLLSLVAAVEGSAGVGGKAHAAVGFKGGQLRFSVGANATWGVGVGTEVLVALDVVEGVKFGIIVFPELQQTSAEAAAKVMQAASEQMSRAMNKSRDIWQSFRGWLSADDKAREVVANRAHTCMPVEERAKLIQTLIGGFCGDDDEQAVLTILRDAQRTGDLGRLLSLVSKDDILWALDGAEDEEARRLLGLTPEQMRRPLRQDDLGPQPAARPGKRPAPPRNPGRAR